MKTTVFLKLEIETDERDDAFAIVDVVLDAGTLQDAIHNFASDHEVVRVLSAVSGGASHVDQWAEELKRR